MKKRILVSVLAFVLILSGIYYIPEKGTVVKAETQGAEVNVDMLQVKAQVSTEQSVIRFIASVDSLDYANVGFEITPEGEETITYTTGKVYERIVSYEKGLEYQFGSKVVDVSSEYLVTAKMKAVSGKLYTVRAFVTMLNGTTVYGDYRCVAMEDGGDTVTNLSFVSEDTTIKTGDILTDVTYGAGNEKTTATVIGVSGSVVHVRVAVEPGGLPSATKFTFGNAGSAVYRNLYTEYKGTADTTWYDIYLEEDSATDKFVIATNADLYGLASIVNAGTSFDDKTVYMCSDIAINDANAVTWSSGVVATGATPYEWTPIGTAREGSDTGYKDALVAPFGGTFDGREHTISGIYINQGSMSWRSLFGATSGNATVKNLRVVDSYFFGRAMSAGIASAGNGTFENLYCEATVISNASTCSGGIVGRSDVSAVIMKNCWFNGTLSTARSGEAQTGGIVGRITASGSRIENCLNSGTVSASSATSAVGGLIGKIAATSVEIADCLSVGTVITNAGQGALVGSVASGTTKVADSYASASACANVVGSGSIVDASDTTIADTTVLQVALSDITGTVATSNLAGMDFETVWATTIKSTPILKRFEDMVEAIVLDVSWYDESVDTYVLYDRADLYGLAEIVNSGITLENKTVRLGADIVMNPGNAKNWEAEAPKYNWTPIGYRNGSGTFIQFQGTFEGNNHTISGLYLNTSNRFTGLFGVIGSSATIQNIKLENSYLSATAADTGAIVGLAQGGKLLNVYTDAIVKNTSGRLGGLVGQINNSTTLERCWFDGKVTCTGNGNGLRATGGFIGTTVTKGTTTITNCLNTGIVDASAYAYAQGTMVNSLAGGMVGQVSNSTTVSLTCCLNTTNILVNEKATIGYGSVIGYVDGSKTITNVYSIDTCKTNSNGKPTDTFSFEEITGNAAVENLKGFDFETVWKTVEEGTPILR